MLKISTRGQYALMTMEVLAEQDGNSYVPHEKNFSQTKSFGKIS